MAIVQNPPLSTQLFDTYMVDHPKIGVLNSKALPQGESVIYIHAKLYKITDKKGSEPRIVCAISLLNNLEYEPETDLETLKKDKRVGFIHVQDGAIKSITLTKNQIQMMQDNHVNEIAFKVNQTVLVIKDKMVLKEFIES